MAKVFNFNKAEIEALKPAKNRQYYQDEKISRLGLCVTPTGTKSFFTRLTINGKSYRRAIGTFPIFTVSLARKQALQAMAIVAEGKDPLQLKREKQISDITLQTVLDTYISSKELKPTTVKDYRLAISHSCPPWLDKPLGEITEKKVLNRYLEQGKISKARTDNGFRVLRALFNFARAKYKKPDGQSYFPSNPVDVLAEAKVKYKPVKRRGILASESMPAFWNEVQSWDNIPVKQFMLFVLFTGVRHAEAKNLEWSDINLKAGTFYIADPKNNKPINLPLPNYISTMLKSNKNKYGRVFPTVRGGQRFVDVRFHVRLLKTATDSNFIVHDLRRTFISLANGLEINAYTVKWLVNHTIQSGDITSQYDVPDMDRLKRASSLVEAKIIRLATGEQVNAVPLKIVS